MQTFFYLANFHCFKLPNIDKINLPSGHTGLFYIMSEALRILEFLFHPSEWISGQISETLTPFFSITRLCIIAASTFSTPRLSGYSNCEICPSLGRIYFYFIGRIYFVLFLNGPLLATFCLRPTAEGPSNYLSCCCCYSEHFVNLLLGCSSVLNLAAETWNQSWSCFNYLWPFQTTVHFLQQINLKFDPWYQDLNSQSDYQSPSKTTWPGLPTPL